MIALVTSCIHPEHSNGPVRSFFSPQERLQQTLFTIEKLRPYNFSAIYLLDNSAHFDPAPIVQAAGDVRIRHVRQYQFANKGINEILLLLTVLDELPEREALFKISGRYFPNTHFSTRLDWAEFRCRGHDFHSKRGTISTRGYFVANKSIYERFLLQTLQEMLSYTKRIVGFRSAGQAIKGILKPYSPEEAGTSIEFAAAKVLKNNDYRVELCDSIGIEGRIAGFSNTAIVQE